MIRELFLPQKLFGLRLIPQNILGISIDRTAVYATLVYVAQEKTSINACFKTSIDEGTYETFNKRASEAVASILKSIKKPDQIRVSVPASFVVFKELLLPFHDTSKIRSVLAFELEELLPFPPSEAAIDFVSLGEEESGKTVILAAAVRKTDLQELISLYAQAGIDPDCVSVDLFALHSIYEKIPEYASIKQGSALVDMGSYSTRLAFLQNGKIRLVRSFQQGFLTIVNAISEETGETPATITEFLKTVGASNKPSSSLLAASIQKHLVNYLHAVQFTLNSFSITLKFYGSIEKIVFSGNAALIKNFDQFAGTVLQTSCEFFMLDRLFGHDHLHNQTSLNTHDLQPFIVALGTALPSPLYENFNLRHDFVPYTAQLLLVKQIQTALIIFVLTICTLGGIELWQYKRLQHAKKTTEDQILTQVTSSVLSPENDLLNADAKRSLKNASKRLAPFLAALDRQLDSLEEIWLYQREHQIDPLRILADVTKTIDRKTFNITVQSLDIKRDDTGAVVAEIELIMSSRSPESNDWKAFTDFIATLHTSKYFTVGQYREELAEGGGVKVTLPLVLKDRGAT